jgi:hypothetical protein
MSAAAQIATGLAKIMAGAQQDENPPPVEKPTADVAYFVITTPLGTFRIDVAAL